MRCGPRGTGRGPQRHTASSRCGRAWARCYGASGQGCTAARPRAWISPGARTSSRSSTPRAATGAAPWPPASPRHCPSRATASVSADVARRAGWPGLARAPVARGGTQARRRVPRARPLRSCRARPRPRLRPLLHIRCRRPRRGSWPSCCTGPRSTAPSATSSSTPPHRPAARRRQHRRPHPRPPWRHMPRPPGRDVTEVRLTLQGEVWAWSEGAYPDFENSGPAELEDYATYEAPRPVRPGNTARRPGTTSSRTPSPRACF